MAATAKYLVKFSMLPATFGRFGATLGNIECISDAELDFIKLL